MMRPACGVVAISSLSRPRSPDRFVRRDCAARLGPYPNVFAASRTRARVSSATRVCGVSLSTCETVVTETPANSATSRMPVLFTATVLPSPVRAADPTCGCAPRMCGASPLHRTEREAGDDVPLEEQGEQDDGNRVHGGKGGHRPPVETELGLEVGDHDGRRLCSHGGEEQREEELVPGREEGE